jgi:hypothetical protein
MAYEESLGLRLTARVDEFVNGARQATSAASAFGSVLTDISTDTMGDFVSRQRRAEAALGSIGKGFDWAARRITTVYAAQAIAGTVAARSANSYNQTLKAVDFMAQKTATDMNEVNKVIERQSSGISSRPVIAQAMQELMQTKLTVREMEKVIQIAKNASVLKPWIPFEHQIKAISSGIRQMNGNLIDNFVEIGRLDQVYARHARMINKSAEALSIQEKQQAIVNAMVSTGTAIMGQHDKALQDGALVHSVWKKNLEEINILIGQHALPIYKGYGHVLVWLTETMKQSITKADEFGSSITTAVSKVARSGADLISSPFTKYGQMFGKSGFWEHMQDSVSDVLAPFVKLSFIMAKAGALVSTGFMALTGVFWTGFKLLSLAATIGFARTVAPAIWGAISTVFSSRSAIRSMKLVDGAKFVGKTFFSMIGKAFEEESKVGSAALRIGTAFDVLMKNAAKTGITGTANIALHIAEGVFGKGGIALIMSGGGLIKRAFQAMYVAGTRGLTFGTAGARLITSSLGDFGRLVRAPIDILRGGGQIGRGIFGSLKGMFGIDRLTTGMGDFFKATGQMIRPGGDLSGFKKLFTPTPRATLAQFDERLAKETARLTEARALRTGLGGPSGATRGYTAASAARMARVDVGEAIASKAYKITAAAMPEQAFAYSARAAIRSVIELLFGVNFAAKGADTIFKMLNATVKGLNAAFWGLLAIDITRFFIAWHKSSTDAKWAAEDYVNSIDKMRSSLRALAREREALSRGEVSTKDEFGRKEYGAPAGLKTYKSQIDILKEATTKIQNPYQRERASTALRRTEEPMLIMERLMESNLWLDKTKGATPAAQAQIDERNAIAERNLRANTQNMGIVQQIGEVPHERQMAIVSKAFEKRSEAAKLGQYQLNIAEQLENYAKTVLKLKMPRIDQDILSPANRKALGVALEENKNAPMAQDMKQLLKAAEEIGRKIGHLEVYFKKPEAMAPIEGFRFDAEKYMEAAKAHQHYLNQMVQAGQTYRDIRTSARSMDLQMRSMDEPIDDISMAFAEISDRMTNIKQIEAEALKMGRKNEKGEAVFTSQQASNVQRELHQIMQHKDLLQAMPGISTPLRRWEHMSSKVLGDEQLQEREDAKENARRQYILMGQHRKGYTEQLPQVLKNMHMLPPDTAKELGELITALRHAERKYEKEKGSLTDMPNRTRVNDIMNKIEQGIRILPEQQAKFIQDQLTTHKTAAELGTLPAKYETYMKLQELDKNPEAMRKFKELKKGSKELQSPEMQMLQDLLNAGTPESKTQLGKMRWLGREFSSETGWTPETIAKSKKEKGWFGFEQDEGAEIEKAFKLQYEKFSKMMNPAKEAGVDTKDKLLEPAQKTADNTEAIARNTARLADQSSWLNREGSVGVTGKDVTDQREADRQGIIIEKLRETREAQKKVDEEARKHNPEGKKAGGWIANTKTETDAIPIWVTGGEYIINKQAMQQPGARTIAETLNRQGSMDIMGQHMGFADGGPVPAKTSSDPRQAIIDQLTDTALEKTSEDLKEVVIKNITGKAGSIVQHFALQHGAMVKSNPAIKGRFRNDLFNAINIAFGDTKFNDVSIGKLLEGAGETQAKESGIYNMQQKAPWYNPYGWGHEKIVEPTVMSEMIDPLEKSIWSEMKSIAAKEVGTLPRHIGYGSYAKSEDAAKQLVERAIRQSIDTLIRQKIQARLVDIKNNISAAIEKDRQARETAIQKPGPGPATTEEGRAALLGDTNDQAIVNEINQGMPQQEVLAQARGYQVQAMATKLLNNASNAMAQMYMRDIGILPYVKAGVVSPIISQQIGAFFNEQVKADWASRLGQIKKLGVGPSGQDMWRTARETMMDAVQGGVNPNLIPELQRVLDQINPDMLGRYNSTILQDKKITDATQINAQLDEFESLLNELDQNMAGTTFDSASTTTSLNKMLEKSKTFAGLESINYQQSSTDAQSAIDRYRLLQQKQAILMQLYNQRMSEAEKAPPTPPQEEPPAQAAEGGMIDSRGRLTREQKAILHPGEVVLSKAEVDQIEKNGEVKFYRGTGYMQSRMPKRPDGTTPNLNDTNWQATKDQYSATWRFVKDILLSIPKIIQDIGSRIGGTNQMQEYLSTRMGDMGTDEDDYAEKKMYGSPLKGAQRTRSMLTDREEREKHLAAYRKRRSEVVGEYEKGIEALPEDEKTWNPLTWLMGPKEQGKRDIMTEKHPIATSLMAGIDLAAIALPALKLGKIGTGTVGAASAVSKGASPLSKLTAERQAAIEAAEAMIKTPGAGAAATRLGGPADMAIKDAAFDAAAVADVPYTPLKDIMSKLQDIGPLKMILGRTAAKNIGGPFIAGMDAAEAGKGPLGQLYAAMKDLFLSNTYKPVNSAKEGVKTALNVEAEKEDKNLQSKATSVGVKKVGDFITSLFGETTPVAEERDRGPMVAPILDAGTPEMKGELGKAIASMGVSSAVQASISGAADKSGKPQSQPINMADVIPQELPDQDTMFSKMIASMGSNMEELIKTSLKIGTEETAKTTEPQKVQVDVRVEVDDNGRMFVTTNTLQQQMGIVAAAAT